MSDGLSKIRENDGLSKILESDGLSKILESVAVVQTSLRGTEVSAEATAVWVCFSPFRIIKG